MDPTNPSFEELFAQNGMNPALMGAGGLGQVGPATPGAGGEGAPLGLGNAPPQGTLPPTAAPTQGMMPPQGMPPSPAPGPGGLAPMQSSLVGMGLGMMGGGWAGGARGYASGAGIDQQRAAHAATLVQHAADQAQAERHFQANYALQTAPQLVKIKGMFGEEIMQRDPLSGKLTPYSGAGGAGGAGAAGAEEVKYNEEGVSPEYLEQVRKKYGAEVADGTKAVAEGRMPSGGFGNIKQLQMLAATYKLGFNARDYALHLQTERAFEPGGKYAEKKRALNQAATHGDQLFDLSQKLGGYDVLPSGIGGGMLNRGYQNWQASGGSPQAQEYQRLLGRYNEVAAGLGQEMVKAAATNSDVKAAHEHMANLSSAKTPSERIGALQGAFQYLHGSHQALENLRSDAFKHAPILSPESQAAYDKILNYTGGQPSGAAKPATAGAAPPGPASPGMKWQRHKTTGEYRQVPQ